MKKITKINNLILFLLLTFFFAFIFRELYVAKRKNEILNRVIKLESKKVVFPDRGYVIENNKIFPLNNQLLDKNLKLVCKVNLDCSVCVKNMSKIYKFYLKLKKKDKNLKFVIIVKDYPCSYVSFFVNKSLSNFKKYEVWVFMDKNVDFSNMLTNVFLLNKENKILTCGNILLHPFLKERYFESIDQD